MAFNSQSETNPLPLARRPGLVLERRDLTLLFGFVLLIPILLVIVLSMILPAAHDRTLTVTAELINGEGAESALRLHNIGQTSLHALRIELNGAFAFFPQAPLLPDKSVDFPLKWFMKKTGSHLDPSQTTIRTVHVSARLPGNQRAIFEKHVGVLPDSAQP